MSLRASLREHYVRQFPGDAARFVESEVRSLEELGELSTEALTRLLEHVDPARLKSMFLELDSDRQEGVLEAASERTVLLLLRALRA